ncbi:MAG: 50S ribosomal protein L23 [Planctomycetota bacterium]
MTTLEQSYQLIRKPVITEKATGATVTHNAYTFRVPVAANKIEIRGAVQRLFGVRVVKVNTLRTKPKWRRRGRSLGQTRAWKKAIVVLQEGQNLELL